ncbi:hypothetical protein ACFQNF_08810 [Iodobacter arcticus]|uniref:Glycosyltransferase n=1 Tax=Iodobacter arcticus TaxID=590593 RepID=A0ABW2R1U8_9NEIS
MLVFIAPYPDCNNEQDGMIQRIASIDSNFESRARVYLDISFRRFFKKNIIIKNNLTIYKLNLFFSFITILCVIARAKTLYVHSVYNALKILPFFYFKKIITDMHGVVPEEMLFEGNKMSAFIYNWTEKITVKKSYSIISVTKMMAEHFKNKYDRDCSFDLIIPIITHKVSSLRLSKTRMFMAPLVIYAGGLQKWQNVPKMLEAVKRNSSVRYRFLTGKPAEMLELAHNYGILNLEVKSVVPSLVEEHYLESDYGFLLRDDILLNKVACPTKGIEYLANGVVPIVLSKDVGDFFRHGYQFVTYEDFILDELPSLLELDKMKKKNYDVISSMKKEMEAGLTSLRSIA